MTTSYQNLRPAQRMAALSALKAAIDVQLKVEKEAVIALASDVGVKSFTTELGAITIVEKDAGVNIDPIKALDWAKENQPEIVQTIEVVPDWFLAELARREYVVTDDGDVYNPDGTEAPFAVPGAKPEPYATWPASKEQKRGKEMAAEFIQVNLVALSQSLLGVEPPAVAAPATSNPALGTALGESEF